MDWTKAKTKKDLVLEGISIDVDRSDASVRSVTFTDSTGHVVRVRYSDYSMAVEIPALPTTKEKFAVVGSIAGVPVNETFEDSYAANSRKRDLENVLRGDEPDLKVESVQVPEEIPF
jgi:hypothetical protein